MYILLKAHSTAYTTATTYILSKTILVCNNAISAQLNCYRNSYKLFNLHFSGHQTYLAHFFIPLHDTYNVSVHNVYSMCMLTYCITIRFHTSTANLVLHPRVNFTYTAQVKPVLRHLLMMWYTVAESRRCSSLERMLWIFVKNVVTYCEKYGGLLATATHTYIISGGV